MGIVKQYHKDTDTTYVYESISYWDPEKKQSRAKRRLIGKLDPVSGEVIPTGKKGRKKKEPEETASKAPSLSQEDADLIYNLRVEISTFKSRIEALEDENRRLRQALNKAVNLAGKIQELNQ